MAISTAEKTSHHASRSTEAKPYPKEKLAGFDLIRLIRIVEAQAKHPQVKKMMREVEDSADTWLWGPKAEPGRAQRVSVAEIEQATRWFREVGTYLNDTTEKLPEDAPLLDLVQRLMIVIFQQISELYREKKDSPTVFSDIDAREAALLTLLFSQKK